MSIKLEYLTTSRRCQEQAAAGQRQLNRSSVRTTGVVDKRGSDIPSPSRGAPLVIAFYSGTGSKATLCRSVHVFGPGVPSA